MTEISGHTEERRFRSVVSGRLLGARWPLAVLALCLLAAWKFGGLHMAFAAIAFAVVSATAALVPRRAIGTMEPDLDNDSSKRRLENISAFDLAAAVPDALLVFDGEGATLHANEAAVAAFGAFTLGLPLQRRFRAPEMQLLIETMLSGAAESSVVDYVERVPIERVFRVTATRIRSDTALFVAVLKDQSEARRIDRMRADFIANASHELRTPLASITGFVEALRGPARNDAAARESFLKIMQEQTGRMARLIDDLLSLSRLEMKAFLPAGIEVDLRETIDSVIDSLGPLAREAGVEVSREFPDSPVIVAGSRDELFQVFENLLENACKYGQSGGKAVVSITPPEASAEGETSVTFRDFGPGIAAEHIPRITERFYRVDVDASRGRKGTGLGLAIVKHILTRHNARLSIKSEVGKGSAFTVHFPARARKP
jgi:two-component system, OmpR family, phosphate regulon sensor histidine kinase PhoR